MCTQVRPRSGYRARSQAGHGSTSGPSQKHLIIERYFEINWVQLQYWMCSWKHAYCIPLYSIYCRHLCARWELIPEDVRQWKTSIADTDLLMIDTALTVYTCIRCIPAAYRGTKARQSSHRHGRGPHATLLHYCNQRRSVKHPLMTTSPTLLFLSACLTVCLTVLIIFTVHACIRSAVRSQSVPLLVLQEPIGNIAATVGMATGPIAGAWEFSSTAFCHTRFRIQCLAQLLLITTSSMTTSCQLQVAKWVCLSLEETEDGKVLLAWSKVTI